MQTITKSYDVYTFDELSDKAKQKALDEYRYITPYYWADDSIESLKAFADAIDITLVDYSINFYNCSPSDARIENYEHTLDQEDASQIIKNGADAKWTGYIADCFLADGFRKEWDRGERDTKELFYAAFHEWLKAAQNDCEAQYSEEAYREHSEMNDYKFLSDGSLFTE